MLILSISSPSPPIPVSSSSSSDNGSFAARFAIRRKLRKCILPFGSLRDGEAVSADISFIVSLIVWSSGRVLFVKDVCNVQFELELLRNDAFVVPPRRVLGCGGGILALLPCSSSSDDTGSFAACFANRRSSRKRSLPLAVDPVVATLLFTSLPELERLRHGVLSLL